MERTCSFCGKYFESYPEDKQRYCSEECHKKYLDRQRAHYILKSDVHDKCVFCGQEIKNKRRGAKYCSDLCRKKQSEIKRGIIEDHGELTKICPVCGNEFRTWKSKKITCSDKCSKKWHSCQTQDQKDKRREYDHKKWLKKHPDALTQAERNEVRRKQKEERLLAEAPERERRKQEQKRREEERARLRAEKEKKKQENIAHWLEYEAEHTCENCGKAFIAHYPLAKYCSEQCLRKIHKVRRREKSIMVDRGITVEKLVERDNGICHICGLPVDMADFYINENGVQICGDMYPSRDHVRPISLGGLHSWDNIKLAHRICNTKKSNKYIG